MQQRYLSTRQRRRNDPDDRALMRHEDHTPNDDGNDGRDFSVSDAWHRVPGRGTVGITLIGFWAIARQGAAHFSKCELAEKRKDEVQESEPAEKRKDEGVDEVILASSDPKASPGLAVFVPLEPPSGSNESGYSSQLSRGRQKVSPILRAAADCDKVLRGEREKIKYRRFRQKRRKIRREFEIKREKPESDGTRGDIDRIVDQFFGENNENIIDRGIIDECNFDKDVIEHENKKDTSSNPLRNSGNGVADMSPLGCTQPWLVSADDGSLSDAIRKQEPRGTRTLPKPELPLELRGPKITEAALQIFSRISTPAQISPKSKYLPQVLQRAMRNFEKFYELEQGASRRGIAEAQANFQAIHPDEDRGL